MNWYLTLVIVINANYANYPITLAAVSFPFYVTVGLGSVSVLFQACEWIFHLPAFNSNS